MKNQQTPVILLIACFFIFIILSLFTYWWTVPLASFVFGYLLFDKPKIAFFTNFLFIFMLWTATSIYKDQQVGGAVSSFLSSLAGGQPKILIYILTGMVGGILTGWAAALGTLLRNIISGNKTFR